MATAHTAASSLVGVGSALWDDAVERLTPKDKDTVQASARTDFKGLLELAQSSRAEARQKKLKAKRANGEVVVFADIFAKIAKWIQTFVQVGDIVSQYDPTHAALPWACIRLILQATVNNHEKHAVILDAVETISRILIWAKIHEQLCFPQTFKATEQVKEEFIKLYVAVLSLLASALRFYGKSSIDRALGSLFVFSNKYANYLSSLREQQREIERLSTLIRTEIQLEQTVSSRYRHDELTCILEDIRQPIDRIERTVDTSRDILQENEHEQFLNWICDLPHVKHHKTVYGKVLQGTGQWLLDDEKLLQWQSSSECQILWLHGILGSGKTCLFSILVQHFIAASNQSSGPEPAYFYCLRNPGESSRSDPVIVLRSLLRQLLPSVSSTPIFDAVQQRFRKKHTDGDISLDEAKDFILQIIASQPITFLLIDALDECSRTARLELTDVLQDILQNSTGLVKIFVSSRNNRDIVAQLRDYPNREILAIHNQGDIDKYVNHEVDKIFGKHLLPDIKVPEGLKDSIKTKTCEKAQGMFQWAETQLQFLCSLRTINEVERRLGALPERLDILYDDIYEAEIGSQNPGDKAQATAILQWLLCEQRPLTQMELTCLVAARGEEWNEAKFLVVGEVLELTGHFVELDQQLGIYRFTHLSVREYFEKGHKDFSDVANNREAAIACLNLLKQPQNQRNDALLYASSFWAEHVARSKQECRSHQLWPLLSEFTCSGNTAFITWSKNINCLWKEEQKPKSVRLSQPQVAAEADPPHAIFAVCAWGLVEPLKVLLEHDKSLVHRKNRSGDNPLHVASGQNCVETVEHIISAGADTNANGRNDRTPLTIAVEHGSKSVVKLLVDHGAYTESLKRCAKDLIVAVRCNQRARVQAILDNCGYINYPLNLFCPIRDAENLNREDMVKLLSEHSVHISFTMYDDKQFDYLLKILMRQRSTCTVSPLKETIVGADFRVKLSGVAIEKRRKDIVQLLLDHGVDPNAGNFNTEWPLYRTVSLREEHIAKLLLSGGADVNANGGAPLRDAIISDNENMARLLLEYGADVNADGGAGLSDAIISDNENMARLLLEYGADVNANGGAGLSDAIMRDNERMVRLLLEYRTDVNADRGAALKDAIIFDNERMVRFLLEYGSDVNANGGAVLREAVRRDNERMVQLLLEYSANVDANGGAALKDAIIFENERIVRLLLEYSTDIKTNSGAVLRVAIIRDNKRMVQLLLEYGADVNTNGGAPLRKAIVLHNECMVRLLLEYGADINLLKAMHQIPPWVRNMAEEEPSQLSVDGGLRDTEC